MADASLYERDVVLWAVEQAGELRAAAGSGMNLPLDWENLAEEIEDVARSQRRELKSRVRTLVEHLLKLESSPSADPASGWRETVRRTRLAIDDVVQESPSLRSSLPDLLRSVLPEAAELTAETLVEKGESAAGVEARLRAGGYTAEQAFGRWLPSDADR